MKPATAPPDEDRTTAIGLWTFAESYLDAANIVAANADNLRHTAPAYYLYTHAVELLLKAYLRANGLSLDELKAIGHRLVKLYEAARQRGLLLPALYLPAVEELLETLDSFAKTHEFRYIVTGFTRHPEFDEVQAIIAAMLQSVKPACVAKISTGDR